MSMKLPPAAIEDVGEVLWGHDWEKHMAYALDVGQDEVEAWKIDASRRPVDLKDKFEMLALVRIQQIEVIVTMLKNAGLERPEN